MMRRNIWRRQVLQLSQNPTRLPMSTPPKPLKSKGRSLKKQEDQQRVILLLDMDCFYAQCETVRLGLDPEIPLALIQWNSALAVSYPARKFGIVRGDSFEKIREKSKGECVAIHLPVTTLNDAVGAGGERGQEKTDSATQSQSGTPGDSIDNDKPEIQMEEDVKASYDAEFNQPSHVREEMYKREKNLMRSRNEGKACLDRYRLASSRIFSLIDETLASNLGKKNYILERASIDELFIDVTAFCNNPDNTIDESDTDNHRDRDENEGLPSTEIRFRSSCQTEALKSLQETTICDESNIHPSEISHERALVLGCHIARVVRRAVFEELRFTLSAGISTSKLVGKLGATYGKPNGQAVIFPGAIPKVMDETPIKKARMLGGKLGKKVLSLLPESETNMGSIARLLSLDDLIKGIGEESGRWVFDACRGICTEEVKSTLKVLPKSITAFKSFNGVSYPELEKWTELLARDIMKRVELDTGRNNRMPKSCTLGYTTEYGGPWIGRSVRLTFPTDRDFGARVKRLVENTRKVLTESGHSTVIRLGYSAIDFVDRPAKGIESFFTAETNKSPVKAPKNHCNTNSSSMKQKRPAKPSGIHAFFSSSIKNPSCLQNNLLKGAMECGNIAVKEDDAAENIARVADASPERIETKLTDEEIARQLQNTYDNELTTTTPAGIQPNQNMDKDAAMAFKLQSSYDKEHAVLSRIEKYSSTKRKSHDKQVCRESKPSKKSKIDSYFSCKK